MIGLLRMFVLLLLLSLSSNYCICIYSYDYIRDWSNDSVITSFYEHYIYDYDDLSHIYIYEDDRMAHLQISTAVSISIITNMYKWI